MNVPNLALRAMNEYRRVSPFTYLALRYTLLSSAAQQHLWAKEAAPEIMQRRDGPAYLPCRQYKTVKHGSRLEYRNLHFPCANEALAEAALLAHCADAGGPFAPKADVFSYHLTPPAAGAGSFEPYFKLSSKRQSAIAKACKQCPDDVVLYADIKSFYPSVKLLQAKAAWLRACKEANVEAKWENLGRRKFFSVKSFSMAN